MNTEDPRVPGGRYFNGYWRQEYTVLTMFCHISGGTTWFTVQWAEGHVTTHCTGWDSRRDKVVSAPLHGEYLSEADLYTRLTLKYKLSSHQATKLIEKTYEFALEGRAAVFGPHRIAYRGNVMAFHWYDV